MVSTQLVEIAKAAQAEFGTLNEQQLNTRPAPDKWSVAQCLDHLIVSDSTYFPAFDLVLEGKHKRTLWQKINPFTGFLGTYGLKVLRSRKIKLNAPAIFKPSQSNIPADIVDRFVVHQQQLGKVFDRMEQADLYNEVISSPFTDAATLKIRDVMDIIVEHERRHIDQARRVKKEYIDK